MLTDEQNERASLANEARLDAKAFRENTVYGSEGDPIRLIANANRLDQYADRIEALEAENARLRDALGEICRDSNPDWTERRVYPTDTLDDIHKIAVEAYYFRAALKGPNHDT